MEETMVAEEDIHTGITDEEEDSGVDSNENLEESKCQGENSD